MVLSDPPHIIIIWQSAFSAVEVIGREPDRARRKLREAIEIRDAKPHVNISTGWDLL